jgi:hypothetical protein
MRENINVEVLDKLGAQKEVGIRFRRARQDFIRKGMRQKFCRSLVTTYHYGPVTTSLTTKLTASASVLHFPEFFLRSESATGTHPIALSHSK